MNRKLAAIALLLGLACASSPAAAVITTTNCGRPVSSTVRAQTEKTPIRLTNTADTYLQGSGVSIPIGAGETKCIKVRFTAQFNQDVQVFVRAYAGDQPMNPVSGYYPARPIYGMQAFEWGSRLGAGVQAITIRMSLVGGPGPYYDLIGPWTVVVEVTEAY